MDISFHGGVCVFNVDVMHSLRCVVYLDGKKNRPVAQERTDDRLMHGSAAATALVISLS